MLKMSAFMKMQAAYAPAESYCAPFPQIVAVAVNAAAFFIMILLARIIRPEIKGLHIDKCCGAVSF